MGPTVGLANGVNRVISTHIHILATKHKTRDSLNPLAKHQMEPTQPKKKWGQVQPIPRSPQAKHTLTVFTVSIFQRSWL